MKSTIIVDVIGEIVAKAESDVLTELTAYDSNIIGINYQYGRYQRVVNTLTDWTKMKDGDKKKYPMLFVEQPFTEGFSDGKTQSVNLRVIIARRNTDPKLTEPERYSNNFKPVLYPVYEAFLKRLGEHPLVASNGNFTHDKTDWPFWDAGQDKNPFNDKLDIIELRINNLFFKLKKC